MNETFSYTRRNPTPPKPLKRVLTHPEILGAPEEMLDAGSCKYIHGDPRNPGWRMCGQASIPDKSWCEFHNSLCMVKPMTRPI